MSHPQSALAWMTFCLVFLAAGCSGCTDRAEMDAGESDEEISETDEEIPQNSLADANIDPDSLYDSGWVIGERDETNRYSAAVRVLAQKPPDWPGRRMCAGVLLAPTLALTAAHCMCAPTQGESIRFDRSGCATKAWVGFSYNGPVAPREWRLDNIEGSILIHPEFQMTLDAQGAVITSRADLAVIRLDRPARPPIQIQPIRLATKEVRAGELLTVAGYCFYDPSGPMEAVDRWFTREKVQTPAGNDRFLLGPIDHASYKGDTGGPCLRETNRGLELVGISQRGLGLTPTFTRIAPYRRWLEEQSRLASERH